MLIDTRSSDIDEILREVIELIEARSFEQALINVGVYLDAFFYPLLEPMRPPLFTGGVPQTSQTYFRADDFEGLELIKLVVSHLREVQSHLRVKDYDRALRESKSALAGWNSHHKGSGLDCPQC